jgi:signal transduction histidine kinase
MARTIRQNSDASPRGVLSLSDNPLVRAVGRVPLPIQAKFLVPSVATVLLLAILGVLGLRVIGESNDRVVALGQLQQRGTTYRELQAESVEILGLLNNAKSPGSCFTEFDCSRVSNGLTTRVASLVSKRGKADDPARLGFVPPDDEKGMLAQIARDYLRLEDVVGRIIASGDSERCEVCYGPAASTPPVSQDLRDETRIRAFQEAEPIADQIKELADSLVVITINRSNALIRENQTAFVASQGLFITVAAVSVLLALLLGYLLSGSIVGPVRRMQTRLVSIASGDFSSHVQVSNRDELGSLAANLNRMNDELGRLYEELEAASRHKSEFLATMSHELRTPLNAIIGFSQVLQQQMYGPLNEQQAGYVDDVLSSGQHLLNLINDILDLAKVEAGRMELQPSTFELPELLENAASMVRERATRQGIGLTVATEGSVGVMEGDERKVKQILFNLMSNAVKFTPSGGKVSLSARGTGDQVVISIRDTGIGIRPEDQERIFEEFYQVGTSRTQEGTGLGLALTRRLVELHHGQLTVESEPDVGSTFTVTMPLHQAGIAPEMPTAIPAEAHAS